MLLISLKCRSPRSMMLSCLRTNPAHVLHLSRNVAIIVYEVHDIVNVCSHAISEQRSRVFDFDPGCDCMEANAGGGKVLRAA